MATATNKDFIVKHGLVVTTIATVESTEHSTSTTTGALQVGGGAGIGGNVNIGGDLHVHSTSTFLGTVNLTTGVATPSVTFPDATVQTTRPPVFWTTQSIINAAVAIGKDPADFINPVYYGGNIAIGDFWYDSDQGVLSIMADQGEGNIQFNPLL
jgi:hypothetical protein